MLNPDFTSPHQATEKQSPASPSFCQKDNNGFTITLINKIIEQNLISLSLAFGNK
jgi:hypothetical protein